MTTATTGGFTGDPAEAFEPFVAGTCCGSAPEPGAGGDTAEVSSCCGSAAQDTGGSCCGGPAVAETDAPSAGCCG